MRKCEGFKMGTIRQARLVCWLHAFVGGTAAVELLSLRRERGVRYSSGGLRGRGGRGRKGGGGVLSLCIAVVVWP